MKKYISIIIVLSSIFFFTNCEEELNVLNPATLSVSEFITDAASAQTALLQAYNDMQLTYVNGAYPKMFNGLYADNFDHTGSFPTFTEIWTNNILTNNVNIRNFYRDHYDVINTTTEVIIVIEGLDSEQLAASEREPILAEAHALRAWAYFQLVKVFGGVPIATTTVPLSGDSANNIPRSSEAEVYTYINNEIALAEGKIADVGSLRLNNDALQVLKAKVQLYQEDFQGAENTLEPLIGKYSLASSYEDLWLLNNDTSETIFRLDYNTADANSLAFFFFPSSNGGRREVAPSQELLDDFESDDVRKNMIANNTDFASSYLIKYSDVGSGADQPYVYRYADVLLMYAEVLARRDASNASDYINMVRTRAGLSDVSLNSTNVVNLIGNERRFELFGEGDRWTDIKRLGIAQEIINGKVVGNFEPFKLLWPIPQDEIDNNDAISQEDQNPGY